MSDINTKDVITQYKSGKSPSEIAKQYGTYTNKIRRLLVKEGVELRGRSEAQKISLEGKEHHRKGSKHSEETKQKIAESRHNAWANMSEEEKESFRMGAKERWDARNPEDIEAMRKAAYAAMNEGSQEGSRIEREVAAAILAYGYDVEVHRKHMFSNEELEVDILVPELKTVIEVDGPTHYSEIFGKERLEAQQKSDLVKNGLVLNSGMYMVRTKIEKNTSNYGLRKIIEQVIETLEEIKKGKKTEERLIYLSWQKSEK